MEQEKGNSPGSSLGNESPLAKTAGQKQELRDDLVAFPLSQKHSHRQKFRGQRAAAPRFQEKSSRKHILL